MSAALAAFCARSNALLCSSRYVCRFDPSLSVWAVKGARPRKYQRSCASIRTRLHCTVSMYVCMYMLRVLRWWILVFVNPPCNDAWFMHNSVTGRPVSEWDDPIWIPFTHYTCSLQKRSKVVVSSSVAMIQTMAISSVNVGKDWMVTVQENWDNLLIG